MPLPRGVSPALLALRLARRRRRRRRALALALELGRSSFGLVGRAFRLGGRALGRLALAARGRGLGAGRRRARREGEGYVYSVVDEHDDTYSLFIESSIEPLTLAELIDFIDHSEQTGGWPGGLSLCYNNANLEGGLSRENLRHFTHITSEIYPKLETHYENVFEDWVLCDVKKQNENATLK